MKLKNAFKKIIHSVCLISVLFLSVFFVFPPVESFAESVTFSCSIYSYPRNASATTIRLEAADSRRSLSVYNSSYYSLDASITFPVGSKFYCQLYPDNKDSYWKVSRISFSNDLYSYNSEHEYSGTVSDIRYIDNAQYTLIPYEVWSNYSYIVFYWRNDGVTTGQYSGYFYMFENPPIETPTPDPSTPTPDPSTPTPGPSTPTPSSPTVSPAPPDPNAEAFFGKLGSDAQNGVGAIMTAWTAANSHFYTSVLFIVLPVFLGIVGLIASFFFGGGDDD